MTWLLLILLLLSCLSLVAWGFIERENCYQYPFLIGSFFLILLLPQAVSLFANRDGINLIQVSDESLNRIFIMSGLCLAFSFIGYALPIPRRYLLKPDFNLEPRKLLKISGAYVIIGILFSLFISENIGYQISGTATGIFTVLIFFLRGFLYLGMPIVLAYALKSPSPRSILYIGMSLVIPFYQAIFLGRRSSLFLLSMTILLTIFFVKKIIIPHYIVCLGLIVSLIINVNVSAYRNYLITGNSSDLRQTNFVENSIDYFIEPQASLELRNAALLAQYAVDYSVYGWGSLYWDRVVFYFFPGQFLGNNIKKNLQFDITPGRDELLSSYSYVIPFGTTITGIGEAFSQFDYFGCLLFGITGWICKIIWNRMLLWNSPFLLAVYINFIQASTVGALISGHSITLASIINIFIFSTPIIFYASGRKCNRGSVLSG